MKYLFLIAVSIFAFPAISLAQRAYDSVCTNLPKHTDSKKVAVLTICNQERGMSSLPPLRLYLRLYADGTAEYEENPQYKNGRYPERPWLVKRTLKISAERVAEIIKLGAADDFLSAKGDYPIFHIWDDSGLETTVIFQDKDSYKKTMLRNFHVGDKDNEKHYPASLIALLRLADDIRNPKPVMSKPKILPYTGGTLVAGKTYRGRINFGDAYGMRLTATPKLPYHHSVAYGWTNLADFSELDPDKDFGVRWVVFRVVEKEIDRVRKNQWVTNFLIEIVKVE